MYIGKVDNYVKKLHLPKVRSEFCFFHSAVFVYSRSRPMVSRELIIIIYAKLVTDKATF